MKFVNPEGWPRPSGYSNGVVEGQLLFISGQVGWDEAGAFSPDLIEQIHGRCRMFGPSCKQRVRGRSRSRGSPGM